MELTVSSCRVDCESLDCTANHSGNSYDYYHLIKLDICLYSNQSLHSRVLLPLSCVLFQGRRLGMDIGRAIWIELRIGRAIGLELRIGRAIRTVCIMINGKI